MSLKLPDNIVLKTFLGSEAREIFLDLAWLRIEVFKAFPYLYLGEFEYEKKYLERYFNSKSFFLAALYDDNKIIGATTALKLNEESDDIKSPLIKANINPQTCFYFGESLLLENYRGKGLGNIFFDLRERYALAYSETQSTLFCSVIRPDTHHLKPKNYHPLNQFWNKRGYQPQPLFCEMSWKDIDQPNETVKSLQFWKKDWK